MKYFSQINHFFISSFLHHLSTSTSTISICSGAIAANWLSSTSLLWLESSPLILSLAEFVVQLIIFISAWDQLLFSIWLYKVIFLYVLVYPISHFLYHQWIYDTIFGPSASRRVEVFLIWQELILDSYHIPICSQFDWHLSQRLWLLATRNACISIFAISHRICWKCLKSISNVN